jgi:site-specific DNA-methyltransferase (adenine-specific)
VIWEKHNGSSFHADRFKRIHENAVQFYRGQWADVFKSPVTTPDAVKKVSRRKKRPAHMGDIGLTTFISHDGGPRLMTSVIYARSCHGYAEHPTQKPLEILEPLIRYSVPPGGSVMDPFMGSGSTLVVAKRLGLSAVGIEIEERFCEIAAKRLSQQVLNFEGAA